MRIGKYSETIKGDLLITQDHFTAKKCTIEGDIKVKGATNCLIAQCKITGSIYLENCQNCVVIGSDSFELYATGCNNIFIIGNNAIGGMTLTQNTHLLADQNSFAYVMEVNNIGINGDSVTETYERAECGALRRLQPHTDKDLFVGMTRESEIDFLPIGDYIRAEAQSSDTVIIPPGVYTVDNTFSLESVHSDTSIYAYGACIEMTEYKPIIDMNGLHNVNIFGLTLSYSLQTCGQIHVLEAIDEHTLIAVSAAGLDDEFGKLNTARFSTGFTDVFREGEIYPWGTIGGGYDIVNNGDETFTVTLKNLVGEIHAGDAIACRMSGANKHTIRLIDCKNIHFSDLVTYGYSAALAVLGLGTDENISFERWHNTTPPAPILEQEDYYRYKYLEEQYGVTLGVYIDSQGRYRGTPLLVGSVDAVHVSGTVRGIDITSSLLEGMVDDGSNQHSLSSRLADVVDNGDGTTTITIKGYLSEVYYKMNAYLVNCASITKGDRIFIYNSNGVQMCDTPALSDGEKVGDHSFTILNTKGEEKTYTSNLRSFKVATSAINFDALIGYDLSDDSYEMTNKILVDNLSRNSAGYTIDNVTVCNTRSRGVLVKTVDVTIKNSTFKNLAHTGLYLATEREWGESTVCRDIAVQNCVIDHVGFINNYDWLTFLAPVSIVGPGSKVSKDTLLCRNIIIDGNRFLNNDNDYHVTVNHAQNVKITNNYFAPGLHENQTKPKKVIWVSSSCDVEISDNRYSPYLAADPSRKITVNDSENVFGTDVDNQ